MNAPLLHLHDLSVGGGGSQGVLGVQLALLRRLHRTVEAAQQHLPQLPRPAEPRQAGEPLRHAVAEQQRVQVRKVPRDLHIRASLQTLGLMLP